MNDFQPGFTGSAHLVGHLRALLGLEREQARMEAWGKRLARTLLGGGRLLAAGNGGSAAQAQHLTAELVGRYCEDRVPLAAIALHAETSTLTAIANDYGYDGVFARQVAAHGRGGDILVLLSTSGRSPNLLQAARMARSLHMTTWALTGPVPNALRDAVDEAISIEHPVSAIVQEVHLVAIHLICEAMDVEVRNLQHGEPDPPKPRIVGDAG